MKAEEALSVSKTYVNQTLVGMGALKGAPCTVKSVTDEGDGTQVLTLEWKDTDDVTHTTDITLPAAIFGITDVQDGQTLKYNSTSGKFENSNVSFNAALDDLNDVVITSVLDGQFLAYDNTAGKWENVSQIGGKGLSSNDFTNTLKSKLDGIESNAEVNVIEEIQVNGTALTPTGKAVNVEAITGVKKNGTALTPASGVVDVEAVDSIAVNGVSQTIAAGAVDIDVASNLITETQWAAINALYA